ncbi:MAG: type II secretion system protein [Armatimonadota bacterium]
MKCYRAFTLLEVLVVTAIIAVVASLLFPVFVRAKRGSRAAVDVSHMHQVYLGLCLYEADYGDVMPNSLDIATSYFGSNEILKSEFDTRSERPAGGWTTTPFVPCPKARVPYLISFAYIRTFSDQPDLVWSAVRSESRYGLLASPWDGDAIGNIPKFSECGETLYQMGGGPLNGPIHRINMDGSYFRVAKRSNVNAVGSYWDFFFER